MLILEPQQTHHAHIFSSLFSQVLKYKVYTIQINAKLVPSPKETIKISGHLKFHKIMWIILVIKGFCCHLDMMIEEGSLIEISASCV